MAKIRVDYSELGEVAKLAGKAASEMDEYAKAIDKSVSGPIGSLTGGSTQYTSTVASLAQQKAKALRDKADKYREFQSNTQSFISTAQSADKDVESYINSIKQEDYKSLSWGQKVVSKLYDIYSGVFSGTEIGKVLNIVGSVIELKNELKILAVKKVRDFFVYGKGRYLINIALTVAAAVGAVVALCNPVTGPFAAVIMAAAVIAAAVKVMTAGVTIGDNLKALFMEGDDPGAARYYGNTSSLKDFAKKHIHDKKIQNIAGVVDTVGVVADVVSSVGSLFTKTHTMAMANPDGSITIQDVNQLDWSKATLKENLLKKFGFSQVTKTGADGRPVINVLTQQPVTETKFSGSSLIKNVFGVKGLDYDGYPSVYEGRAVHKTVGTITDVTKAVKNISTPISEITKLSDLNTYGAHNTEKVVKNIFKHVPVVKDFTDAGFKIYDWVK